MMCGIAGIFSYSGQAVNPQQLIKMNTAIAHRGPDDEGYAIVRNNGQGIQQFSGANTVRKVASTLKPISQAYPTGKIGFAHRRLSIIDPSPSGHQPMMDPHTGSVMIYSGEIYNFRDIRKSLENRGVPFKTFCDTEVLLQSYLIYGVDAFRLFKGFWSVAIYDGRNHSLLLCRDRIGQRHIYWTRSNGMIYFASEIKSLLTVIQQPVVNESSVAGWLYYGRKDTDTDTFFKEIFSFPAAHFAFIHNDGTFSPKPFWSLPMTRLKESDITIAEAADKVRKVVFDSVKLRMNADVPIGLELSGGIDSSIIVAAAAQLSSKECQVYTVKFSDEATDEEYFARKVAKKYDVNYHVLQPTNKDIWKTLEALTWLQEEPYHSPNIRTNQVIWEMMRNRGIKVSLNGAAGDECFAGYNHYYRFIQAQLLLGGKWGHYISNAIWRTEETKKLNNFLEPFMHIAGRWLADFRPTFSSGRLIKRNKIKRDIYHSPILYSDMACSDMLQRLMPYWLSTGDRSTMGVPIEVRLPFLDHRIVELGFQLPVTYLFRRGWHKWILRQAFKKDLPPEVLWRKKKMGFPFPLHALYRENPEFLNIFSSDMNNPFLSFTKMKKTHPDWHGVSFFLWWKMFIEKDAEFFKCLELQFAPHTGIDSHRYISSYLITHRNTYGY